MKRLIKTQGIISAVGLVIFNAAFWVIRTQTGLENFAAAVLAGLLSMAGLFFLVAPAFLRMFKIVLKMWSGHTTNRLSPTVAWLVTVCPSVNALLITTGAASLQYTSVSLGQPSITNLVGLIVTISISLWVAFYLGEIYAEIDNLSKQKIQLLLGGQFLITLGGTFWSLL